MVAKRLIIHYISLEIVRKAREREMSVASFNYIGLHKSHSSMSEDGRFVVRIANQMHTHKHRHNNHCVCFSKFKKMCSNLSKWNGTARNGMETGMGSIKWRFCIK